MKEFFPVIRSAPLFSGISEEELDLVARIANGDGDIHKGTRQVEEADVKAAVLAADLMGAAFLAEDGD